MSYFSEVCEDLNLLDNSPEVCQQYIDQTHSNEADQFCPNLTNEIMMDLIKNVYKYSNRLESSSLGDLKCICAAALSTHFHSTESDSIILASRLLISLCSVPSASAYGLSNSNVYNSFLSCLLKVFGAQLKSSSSVASNASKLKKRSRKSNDDDASESEGEGVDEEEGEEFNINIVSDSIPMSQPSLSQRTSARRPVGESAVEMTVLKPFLTDLGDHIHFLAALSDDHLINCTAELLTALLFYCSVKLQNHSVLGFVNQISKAIVEFGVSNQKALMSIYRSLMPCLTMAVRNPMLPDVQKVRTTAHKAAVKVMHELIKQSSTSQKLISTAPVSDETADGSDVEDAEETEEGSSTPVKKTSKTAKVTNSATLIPLPFKCLIGLLQRMTVGCPDRAPIRSTILSSVVDMLSQLYEFQSSNRGVLFGSLGESDELAFELQCVVDSVAAINHYIRFLATLSKSNKVGHRAFSLDIATGLLSTSWVWDLAAGDEKASQQQQSAAACLMNMLLSRCSDASPSVRMRALNAVDDLLLALNDQSSHSMITCLFDVAMGTTAAASSSSNEQEEDATHMSLLDILRERCDDDKPLVRGKALQAFGRALSMAWPRVVTSYKTVSSDEAAKEDSEEADKMETSDNDDKDEKEGKEDQHFVPESRVESSQLAVTDEDLSVLAEHCTDVSLSARKQALQSLTEVLLSRPSAGNIMDLFLSAALPLAFDAESTVVAKLSQSLFELVFVSLYQWHDHFGPRGAGTARPAFFDRVSLVWKLCNKISTMGLLKVLKSVIGSMIRSSILKGHSERNIESRAASLSHIVEMLKVCCCVHLPSSTDALALSEAERSEVSRGAWILLEAIVSQEQMNVVTGAQSSVPVQEFLQKTGSVDFVLRCYRSKHSAADDLSGGHFDAEDLRIFKVLEKLVVNIAPVDAEFVSGELNRLLLDLQSDSQLVAAAVAVKYQLSKLLGGPNKDFKKTYTDIQRWSSEVMSSVYVLLHIYAFGRVSETVMMSALSAPLQSLVQSWVMDRNQSILNNSCITLNQSTFFDLSTIGGTNQSVDELFRRVINTALFTLGELGMIGFRVEEDAEAIRTQKSLKDTTGSTGHWSLKGGVMECKMSESGDSLKLLIPEDVTTLVKIFMGHTLPLTGGDAGEGVRECPVQVRANAFITMGKICLRDKDLARDHVNIFLREINVGSNASAGDNAAVRSNALLILGDLCVRYTHLVDRHVDTMSHCLQDPDSSVRRNALILLTQLLLQDFLKWKGFLLYRFLSLVVDSDYEIAEFARSLLTTTLQQKFPELLSGHMPESVVVLNNCNNHPIYSAIVSTNIGNTDTTNASTVESEVNPLSRAQRMEIYSFMSEKLSDEMKIQVTAKLVQDILALAVDSDSLLPNRSKGAAWVSKHYDLVGDRTTFEGVLEDTLMILRSTILKVGSKKGGPDDLDEDDAQLEDIQASQGAESQKAAMAKAKTKVLKKLSTQHLVNHVLPVVISLKHVLEATKSPLQGMLMEYLMVLVKNHKGEVEQTLQYDPTLKEELEYDMKQFEKAKSAEAAAKAASRTKSPARLSISSTSGIQSVLKPSLKKSLTHDLRGKTPVQAMLLASGMKTRDALLTASKMHPLSDFKARRSLGAAAADEGDDDVVDRLLSQSEPVMASAGKARSNSIASVTVSDADVYDGEAVDDMIAGMKEDLHIAALVSSGLKAPMPRLPKSALDIDENEEEESPSRRTNKVLFQDDESSGKGAFASSKSRRSWSVVACNIEETEIENLPVVNKNRVSIGKKPSATSKRPTETVSPIPAPAAVVSVEEQDEDAAFDKVVEKYTPVKKRTKRGAKGSPTHPINGSAAAGVKAEPEVNRSRLSGGEGNSLTGLSGLAAGSTGAAAVAAVKTAGAGGRGSRTANVASDSLFQLR